LDVMSVSFVCQKNPLRRRTLPIPKSCRSKSRDFTKIP
jgi:hypothetical protein